MDNIIRLEGELSTQVLTTTIVPNPSGETTDVLEKLGIDNEVYQIFPSIPNQVGYYTLDVQVTDNGKQLYWRRLAIPSNSLYPSDIQEV